MDATETDSGAIDDVGPEYERAAGSVNRSQAVTESLLEAAVDVFAEHGFEATRVAEIARRAGLTTGAIYARWRGKSALIIDAVGHVSPRFMDLPPVGAQAPAILAALGTSLTDGQHARSRDVVLEALVSARRNGEFRAAVTRSMEREAERLDEIVANGQAEGSIDPDLSTRAIVALFQSCGSGCTWSRPHRG